MIADRPSDIAYDTAWVLSNLSEVHQDELFEAGVDPIRAFDLFIDFASHGSATTITIDGLAEAVLAVAKGRTWFLATDEYFERSPIETVRHGRKLLKRLAKENGYLTARTLSKHPDIKRWMALHGGELQESNGRGLLYIFR